MQLCQRLMLAGRKFVHNYTFHIFMAYNSNESTTELMRQMWHVSPIIFNKGLTTQTHMQHNSITCRWYA